MITIAGSNDTASKCMRTNTDPNRMRPVALRIRIIDTNVVNDVTCLRQMVLHVCGHTIFMTRRYPLHISDVI